VFGLAGRFCEAVPGLIPPVFVYCPRLPEPLLKFFVVPDKVRRTPDPDIC